MSKKCMYIKLMKCIRIWMLREPDRAVNAGVRCAMPGVSVHGDPT